MSLRWLAVALLALGPACSSCPPGWTDALPVRPGWVYGAASAEQVFVDADRLRVALTRAARVVADALGVEVERRLAVTRLGDTLHVEAWGQDGPRHELDDLELVELVRCGERVHVLVRAPRPPGWEPPR